MNGIPGSRAVAVMFSGGRDSTLAAAYYGEKGCEVHLLTFENGCHQATGVVQSRIDELRRRWPSEIHKWSLLSASKAIRDIALIDLVTDVRRYGENLICLGSALAMVARSIDYCVSRSVPILATGYSGYQRHFPEQSDTAVRFFTSFAAEYSIGFRCPGLMRPSEGDAKNLLDTLGLSPKALEPTGLWDWTHPENVGQDVIGTYLTDKSDIARRFIGSLRAFREASDNAPSDTADGQTV